MSHEHEVTSDELKYCPRCAGHLALRLLDGRQRLICGQCHFVFYLDPKLAVAAIVPYENGILLGKRAIDPRRGHWSFPSGYVDRSEKVEAAAVREVREETGLEVELDGLVGLYSEAGERVVLAVYAARVTGGRLTAGSEMSELSVFLPEALPAMAFPHDQQIMADWHELCARKDRPMAGDWR